MSLWRRILYSVWGCLDLCRPSVLPRIQSYLSLASTLHPPTNRRIRSPYFAPTQDRQTDRQAGNECQYFHHVPSGPRCLSFADSLEIRRAEWEEMNGTYLISRVVFIFVTGAKHVMIGGSYEYISR